MRIWLEVILGALVVLALAALGFRAQRRSRVTAALAIRSPHGIDETGFVSIGASSSGSPSAARLWPIR